MAIKARYLDKDGSKFYPFAHADATFDKNGVKVGKRLDDLDSDKVDKVDGKGLSTNDFNNDYKSALDNPSVLINTTEYWNAQQNLIPTAGTIIVYSDAVATTVGTETVYSPAFKMGDGHSVVGSLEFYNDTVSLKHKLTIGTAVYMILLRLI